MSAHNTPPHGAQNAHNEVILTRDFLIEILNDLSARLLQAFLRQIQIVVHGGAVMLLHPTLASSTTRRTTRDVDYIKRSFVTEMQKAGIYDAEARLDGCIIATATRYGLGTDWFNAHADVALPMAHNAQGQPYDPIYYDSLKPNNVALNTIYTSPGLTLISVTMFWGVALKMVRYQKEDPADILAMLRHGTKLNGVKWTPQVLEGWLLKQCWPMGYAQYPSWKIGEMRQRFQHAIELVQSNSQWQQPSAALTTTHGNNFHRDMLQSATQWQQQPAPAPTSALTLTHNTHFSGQWQPPPAPSHTSVPAHNTRFSSQWQQHQQPSMPSSMPTSMPTSVPTSMPTSMPVPMTTSMHMQMPMPAPTHNTHFHRSQIPPP